MSSRCNSDSDLRWYERATLEMLWWTCRIVAIMPRLVRYHILQPVIVVLLLITRYRHKIIHKNLRLSFPEKSNKERRRIAYNFYRILAEIVVDTISLAGATKERNRDVITWVEPSSHIERVNGRDWIATAAHFGCWEYFPLWCWDDPDALFMSVYHPLKSRIFERFYQRLRRLSPNIKTVAMKDAVRFYLTNRDKGKNLIVGLVADQSPRMRVDSQWFDFLNQPTLFTDGAAILAKRFHLPVYFVDVERIAPGRYLTRLDELYNGYDQIEEAEITRRYAEALEKMIRRQPELWMWSHNRWRHTPEKQQRLRERILLDKSKEAK